MEEYRKLLINFFNDTAVEREEKSRQLLKQLVELIVDSNFNEVTKLCAQVKSMKYSGQGFMQSLDEMDEERMRLFDIGYVHAMIDVMQRYEKKLHAENEINQIKTKYRDRILFYLAKHGTLFHKELASLLKISASSLNEVIKHMNATEIKTVNVEKVSKYTIYSLTVPAYQYVLKHHINDYIEDRKTAPSLISVVIRLSGNEVIECDFEKKFVTSHIPPGSVCNVEKQTREKEVFLKQEAVKEWQRVKKKGYNSLYKNMDYKPDNRKRICG